MLLPILIIHNGSIYVRALRPFDQVLIAVYRKRWGLEGEKFAGG